MAVGTCKKCGQQIRVVGTPGIIAVHDRNGARCAGIGRPPRAGTLDKDAQPAKTPAPTATAAGTTAGTTTAADTELSGGQKVIASLVGLGLLTWITVSIVSGRIEASQADERVRLGVAEVCNNYKQAVATGAGQITTLSSQVHYPDDIDSLEFDKKVEAACPENIRALDEQWSPSSGSSGTQMSDCDRRIYAVTHSGVFTDEEENELIRGINATC